MYPSSYFHQELARERSAEMLREARRQQQLAELAADGPEPAPRFGRVRGLVASLAAASARRRVVAGRPAVDAA